jgi:hypothetical protein
MAREYIFTCDRCGGVLSDKSTRTEHIRLRQPILKSRYLEPTASIADWFSDAITPAQETQYHPACLVALIQEAFKEAFNAG